MDCDWSDGDGKSMLDHACDADIAKQVRATIGTILLLTTSPASRENDNADLYRLIQALGASELLKMPEWRDSRLISTALDHYMQQDHHKHEQS